MIEALRATINGCLRVGDRKRRVVRRSTVDANRLAPLAIAVNDQDRECREYMI